MRGFTGHEHIRQFNIINMNARLYAPRIGRFLSPDNYITDPENPQSYNRYSYVLNNPLKYTDPTGNFGYIPYQGQFEGTTSSIDFSMNGFSLDMLVGMDPSIDLCDLVFSAKAGYWSLLNTNKYASSFGGGGGGESYPEYRTATIEVVADRITEEQSWWGKLWDGIVSIGKSIWNGITSVGKWLWEGIKEIGNDIAENWEYYIPVWGSAKAAGECFDNGDYAGAALNFGMGLIEAGTMTAGIRTGAASKVSFSFSNPSQFRINDIVWCARGCAIGDYGLGEASWNEAMEAGRRWVGAGYRVSKDGKAWISEGGTRIFRPPTFKRNWNGGTIQANFQWRKTRKGDILGNGHLDIIGD